MSLLNAVITAPLTGGQIAIIVIISVLLAAAVGLSIYLAFLLKRRKDIDAEVHIMQTAELQDRYDKLKERLSMLKDGTPVKDLSPLDIDVKAFFVKEKKDGLDNEIK